MKNRISFCVNACKKSTFRFIGGLQNVLRFLRLFSANASSVHPERIIRLGHTHHSFGIDVSSVFPQIYFSISLSSNLLMLCTFSGRMGGRFFS